MRKLIFRGKRIDNVVSDYCIPDINGKVGEWVYGDLIHRRIWKRDIIVIRTDDSGFDSYLDYEIDPSTIGQFTGLTDKNNKKIFEGDIVRTKFGRLCKVRYFVSPAFCGVDLFPLNTKHRPPTDYDIYQKDFLEVVGNIFDNPNPLEVE